jgi:excisionase family DNA binding protein
MNDHLNESHDRAATLDLLTVPEAAKLLRISRNLAYELVARNEIPAIRLGRVIRVPKHGLTEWLERQMNGRHAPATQRSTVAGHNRSLWDGES